MKFHNKPVVAYVPHGIDTNLFYPIDSDHPEYAEVETLREKLFRDKNKDIEYVVFFNSRNIRRKMIPDLILGYKLFCDVIGKEKSKKCMLLLHTQPIDENGTNLIDVIDNLCPEYNISFTGGLVEFKILNQLYNIADITVCIGSNEGWGLSCTESLTAGTPVIANVTGGLQDQMRFETEDGSWIEPTAELPSNHTGYISKKHGVWAIPVYPSNRSIQGSVPTPYIFDDRVAFEDLALAIKKWYDTKPDFREAAGQLGREWIKSDESRMSAPKMGEGIIKCIDYVFDNWKPKKKFELINSKDYKYLPPHTGIVIDPAKLMEFESDEVIDYIRNMKNIR